MAQAYNITYRSKTSFNVCYNKTRTHATGLWNAENAWVASLPLLIIQLFSILLLSHILAYLLRRLRQPRIVANILVSTSNAYLLFISVRTMLHAIDYNRAWIRYLCAGWSSVRSICVFDPEDCGSDHNSF